MKLCFALFKGGKLSHAAEIYTICDVNKVKRVINVELFTRPFQFAPE